MSNEQHAPHIQSGRDTVQAGGNVTQVGHDYVGRDKVSYNYYQIPAPASERERRNRTVMLQKVSDFWIKGVLENSLHRAALIHLGMVYQPEAVAYPWEMIIERSDTEPQALPQGTPIASVFDDLHGELLILGSPGSGKTTMLLDLARTLIAQAQQDERHPIPVVFNLSPWAEQRLPLAAWMVAEFTNRYDVPRQVGQAWIDKDHVLPLLDGLDEVRQDVRAACVEAINTYRRAHGLVGMVVCSRVADYLDLAAKLKLHGAIVLQPLTDEQIDSYLAQAGEQLDAVRVLLRDTPALRVFANTPLMLSIMALAYQGMPPAALPEHDLLDARRQHLFDTYVERMLRRRGGNHRYTPAQTRHWLSWLAGRMVAHGQTVFHLEQMQPKWHARGERAYFTIYSLIVTLSSGVLLGFGFGFLSIPFFGVHQAVLLFGLLAGIVGAMLGGLACYTNASIMTTIVTQETMGWSWMAVRQGSWKTIIDRSVRSVILSAFYGFVIIAASHVQIESGNLLSNGLWGTWFVVVGGIMGALVGVLENGITTDQVQHKTKPNEGMWRSARIAGITWLIGALIFGIAFGGIGGIFGSGEVAVFSMIVGGLTGVMMVGLRFGAAAILELSILRLLLVIAGFIPFNYVRFLDYTSERVLLHKVGGGYTFVHRMLLEYFAALKPEPRRENTTLEHHNG